MLACGFDLRYLLVGQWEDYERQLGRAETMWAVIQQVVVQALVLLTATQDKNTVSGWPDLCAGQLKVTGDGRGELGWRSRGSHVWDSQTSLRHPRHANLHVSLNAGPWYQHCPIAAPQ